MNVSVMSRKGVIPSEQKVKINGGTVSSVKRKTMAHQLARFNYTSCHRSIPVEVPSGALSSTATFKAVIDNDLGKIEHVRFDMNITTSAASTLTPTCNWFNQINVRESKTNTILTTHYPDTSAVNWLMHTRKAQKSILKNINIEGDEVGLMGLTNELPAGTYTFTYYLPGSFWSNWDLYLSNAKSDLVFEFYPNGTIAASGSPTITLNSFKIEVESQILSQDDQLEYDQDYGLYNHSANFLDPVPVHYSTKAMVSGVNTFDLSALEGKCSHLVVAVRPTGSKNTNAGNLNWKLLNVGQETAKFDILDSASRSIWGQGSGVSYRTIVNDEPIHNCDNDFFEKKRYYLLNFSDHIIKAYHGSVDGYFQFSGQKHMLSLDLAGNQPVSEVHTITLGSALSAGTYRFAYKGEMTEPLAYGAVVATMKAALEALKSFKSQNITVTFSGTLASGTSITATYVNPEGQFNGSKIEVLPSSDVLVTTAVTTSGVSGIATPATYDVSIYAYIHRNINYKDGKFAVYTL